MVRRWLMTAHSGVNELLALAALYGLYEVIRGFGGEDLTAALANTDDIVALEQHIGMYVERGVQTSVDGVAMLPTLLGLAYIGLHFVGTTAAVVWVHRARPDAYPLVRTTLVGATALALVGYLAYPAA